MLIQSLWRVIKAAQVIAGSGMSLAVHRSGTGRGPGFLVVHACVAAPHGGALGRQQIVRRLRHARAHAVEPFLTRRLTKDGLLIVVHLALADPTRVHGLGRGRAAPPDLAAKGGARFARPFDVFRRLRRLLENF